MVVALRADVELRLDVLFEERRLAPGAPDPEALRHPALRPLGLGPRRQAAPFSLPERKRDNRFTPGRWGRTLRRLPLTRCGRERYASDSILVRVRPCWPSAGCCPAP